MNTPEIIQNQENLYGIPPPPYEIAVTLTNISYTYTPPPNYHDIVSGYIDPRPSINLNNILPNIQDEFSHINDPECTTVTVNNHVYYDISGMTMLLIYNIPLYIIGPYIYTVLFNHISAILNTGTKTFPLGLDYNDTYIILSYGVLLIFYLIIRSVIMFILGYFSYLSIFNINISANLSFITNMIIIIMNIFIIRIIYMIYSICDISYNMYIQYIILLIVYSIILKYYIYNIYKNIAKYSICNRRLNNRVISNRGLSNDMSVYTSSNIDSSNTMGSTVYDTSTGNTDTDRYTSGTVYTTDTSDTSTYIINGIISIIRILINILGIIGCTTLIYDIVYCIYSIYILN
ncbi:hypothetical protein NEPAR05_0602 [Nematocida parisii]|nr:hypothetical protein NEPAR05_0602 [Nematocida parisii]